jgi:hypothetical protein
MSKFHDPGDSNFRGAIKVEHILCDGCAQEKAKTAAERVYVPLTPGPAVFNRAPAAPPAPAEGFVRPSKDVVHDQAIDLLHFLQQGGYGATGLRQGTTGSFYLVFKGPVSQTIQKIRVSDHPKPIYTNPDLAEARHTDFDVDPRPGHTPADAKAWAKTAAKDVIAVGTQEINIYVDPAPSVIAGLCGKSGSCGAFVFANGEHVLAWDSKTASHDQLRDYLRVHGVTAADQVIAVDLQAGREVKVAAGTPWATNPEAEPLLKSSPALRLAMDGVPRRITFVSQEHRA